MGQRGLAGLALLGLGLSCNTSSYTRVSVRCDAKDLQVRDLEVSATVLGPSEARNFRYRDGLNFSTRKQRSVTDFVLSWSNPASRELDLRVSILPSGSLSPWGAYARIPVGDAPPSMDLVAERGEERVLNGVSGDQTGGESVATFQDVYTFAVPMTTDVAILKGTARQQQRVESPCTENCADPPASVHVRSRGGAGELFAATWSRGPRIFFQVVGPGSSSEASISGVQSIALGTETVRDLRVVVPSEQTGLLGVVFALTGRDLRALIVERSGVGFQIRSAILIASNVASIGDAISSPGTNGTERVAIAFSAEGLPRLLRYTLTAQTLSGDGEVDATLIGDIQAMARSLNSKGIVVASVRATASGGSQIRLLNLSNAFELAAQPPEVLGEFPNRFGARASIAGCMVVWTALRPTPRPEGPFDLRYAWLTQDGRLAQAASSTRYANVDAEANFLAPSVACRSEREALIAFQKRSEAEPGAQFFVREVSQSQ
jgi:hypothetical protein